MIMASVGVPLPPLDPRLELHPLFFALPPDDVNYVKIIFESYECFGVVRTQDTEYAAGYVLLVLLLVPDFIGPALEVTRELAAQVDMTFPTPTRAMLEELRCDLLGELMA